MSDRILYGLVDPKAKTVKVEGFYSDDAALRALGINPLATDSARCGRRRGIIVAEYGMFVPPSEQHFFSIGPSLYAGNAVLYDFNERGMTVSYKAPVSITWYENAQEVELSIGLGRIIRPQMAVNGEVLWTWPEPRQKADA